MQEQAMTTKEAQQALKISRPTLMKLIHQGRLFAANIGSKHAPEYRISNLAVSQFLGTASLKGGE